MQLDLRLLLITVGVIIILAVIIDAFFRKKTPSKPLLTSPKKTKPLAQPQPVLKPKKTKITTDTIISFGLLPKNKLGFDGKTFSALLEKEGFHLGENNIFHYYVNNINNNKQKEVLCSLAQLVEPGDFEPENYQLQQYPGFVIFMILPKVQHPEIYFDKMLSISRKLALNLDGRLCDAKSQDLSKESIEKYRNQIKAYLNFVSSYSE